MTGWVAVVALIAGAISTEWLVRGIVRAPGLRQRWTSGRAAITRFRVATDDDARQEHITRAGMDILVASLSSLMRLVVMGVIFVLPAYAVARDEDEWTVYLATATVAAIVWWLVRRRVFAS